jgi:hypothetical protein
VASSLLEAGTAIQKNSTAEAVLKSKLTWQTTEKLSFESVILSAAKDLLFARVASKADPSLAQNRATSG